MTFRLAVPASSLNAHSKRLGALLAREAGWPDAAISAAMGVSDVERTASANVAAIRCLGCLRPGAIETNEQIIRLFGDGHTRDRIACMLSIGDQRVTEALRGHGRQA